ILLSAMVRFHVYDPRILRRVLFFVGEVKQHIETGEVLIVVNSGLGLLLLEGVYFANRLYEVIHEFLFCFTKSDLLENVRPGASF
ncbi:MAG: hypothetical protein ABSF22_25450, partial [Bryobacteraceae bacterium]